MGRLTLIEQELQVIWYYIYITRILTFNNHITL